jgi:hypothetical protein
VKKGTADNWIHQANGVVKRFDRLAITVAEAAFLLQISDSHMRESLPWFSDRGVVARTIACKMTDLGPRLLIPATPFAQLIDGPTALSVVVDVPLVWTLPQAAKQLGVTEIRFRSAIRTGAVHGIHNIGRTVRVSRRLLAAQWEAIDLALTEPEPDLEDSLEATEPTDDLPGAEAA